MTSLFHRLSCAFALALLAATGGLAQAQRPTPAALPPFPPPAPTPVAASPVGYFRLLLSATPAEREQLLAGKSAEQRRVLTNSIRTYLALPATERELRLRTMELSSHLAPLIRLTAAERQERLKAIPEEYRGLVQERLVYWDALATNVQHMVLAKETGRRTAGLLVPAPPVPTNLPVGMEAILAPWKATNAARQQEAVAILNQLSEPRGVPSHTLDQLPLSPKERALIEQALVTFRQLAPAQRQACISAFKRFAELPPLERVQFLRNAEAWQKMAPEDRQRWRDLVNRMPSLPPLPPGFGLPPIPVPRTATKPPSSTYVSNSPAGQ